MLTIALIGYAIALVPFLIGIVVLAFRGTIASQDSWKAGMLVTVAGSALTTLRYLLEREEKSTHALTTLMDTLAESVAVQASNNLGQLITTRSGLDTRFRRIVTVGRDDRSASATGRFSEVLEYYQNTEWKRLVITGPGGAGKTVLLNKLALRLLNEPAQSDRRIPVILTLDSWDMSRSFREWVIEQLAKAPYQMRIADAERLVEARRIRPLLDGLDEMDPGDPRRRATEALKRLRDLDAGDPMPLVLTCRTDAYQHLIDDHKHLQNASTVELLPLMAQELIRELRSVVDIQRWKPVIEELKAHPSGDLARQLGSPLHIAIALQLEGENTNGVYGHDPVQLVVNASANPLYLLDIYARMLFVEGGAAKKYGSSSIWRMLVAIAAYLEANGKQRREVGGRTLSSVQFVTHQLWPIAGNRLPRIATAALSLVFWVPGLAAAIWFIDYEKWFPLPGSGIMAAIAILPMVSFRSSLAMWPHPRHIALSRFGTGSAWIRLGSAAVVAAIMGAGLEGIGGGTFAAACAVTYCLVFGLGMALAVRDSAKVHRLAIPGVAVGIPLAFIAQSLVGFLGEAAGIVAGAAVGGVALVAAVAVATKSGKAAPGYVTNPTHARFIRRDLVTGIASGVAVASMAVSAFWLTPGLRISIVPAIAIGLCGGASIAFGFTTNVWRRHIAMWACMHGQTPLLLDEALQYAYNLRLLRLAGIAYEFRHMELRDYFASQGPDRRS